ncbi:thioredoxin family protein [Tenacibaculum sp. M341]|uniref:thioredoxin family protein n=1 Tax=Tenacibaculum sp. M341 TaxID=2530339 RepID=UPI001047B827|nr:thioredoxin family protein [Tenacibaculum sp. M341]TCI92274.1 thioredoxin [Tenacibaculum sp. M341]
MKKIISIICFLSINVFCAAQGDVVVNDGKGNKMLLGKVNRKHFDSDHFDWFSKNYKAYLTNDKIINKLKKELSAYKIKAFFGSWCGDSKRNIPIFYKILDEANFSEKNIEIYAVDKKKEAYKQSPNHEEKGLNIHRVPTFILYKEGKEVNRIVEHPVETFERDLLKIVEGERYRVKYSAVAFLEKLLTQQKDSFQKKEKELVSFLPDIAQGVKELNTYGFVKLRANNNEEAKLIFQLNAKMYPNHYIPYQSLGSYYYKQKEYKRALKNLYKSLSVYANNEKAKEMIHEIEASINK